MSKIYAIMGGGDWADASVSHVVMEQGDVEQLTRDWKAYRQVRSDIICRNAVDGKAHSVPVWINLEDWLLAHGGRRPTKDELEEVWDD